MDIFAKKRYSHETLRDAYIRLEPHAELSRGLWPLGLSHAWTEYQGVSASAHFIFLDIFQVYFRWPLYISRTIPGQNARVLMHPHALFLKYVIPSKH